MSDVVNETAEAAEDRGRRKVREGYVVSDKMDKTGAAAWNGTSFYCSIGHGKVRVRRFAATAARVIPPVACPERRDGPAPFLGRFWKESHLRTTRAYRGARWTDRAATGPSES